MGDHMNLNDLAKYISQHEGLKKEVDIAQIKEIVRVLCQMLGSEDGVFVAAALFKRASSM